MNGKSSNTINKSPSIVSTKRTVNIKEENEIQSFNASDYMKIDSKQSGRIKNQIKNSLPRNDGLKNKVSNSQQIAQKVKNSVIINNDESLYLSLIGQSNTEGYFKSTKLGQTLLDVSISKTRKVSQENIKDQNLKYDNEFKKKMKSSSISFNFSNSHDIFNSQFFNKEKIPKLPEILKKSDEIMFTNTNLLSPIHENRNNSPPIKTEKNFILDIDETQLTNFEKSYSKLQLMKCDESPIDNQMNLYAEESPEKLEIAKVQLNQLSVEYDKIKESTDYQSQYKRNASIQNNRYVNNDAIENNADSSAEIQMTENNNTKPIDKTKIATDCPRSSNKNDLENANLECINKIYIAPLRIRKSQNLPCKEEEEHLEQETPQEHEEVEEQLSMDDFGNVDEFNESDNFSQRSKYFNKNKEPLKVSIIEVELDQVSEKQKTYDELVKKYLFWDSAHVSADEGEDNSRSLSHNESMISVADKDLDLIKSSTVSIKRKRKKIKKEIKLIESEIKELLNHKSTEMEKLKSIKEKEIGQLKEKLKSEEIIKEDQSLKKLYYELQTVQMNIEKKEENYKNIVKSLLGQLKSQAGDKYNCIKMDNIDLDSQNLKELNEAIEFSLVETQNFEKSKEKNNSCDHSILLELDEFKKEDIANYNYDIPQTYQISQDQEVKLQQTQNDQTIKFYTNSAIEIIAKNKTITRLFPDGYSVIFYPNKDIKQTLIDGKVIYFYYKNKSCEFNVGKEGYVAYKFRNKQLEKHFFDGRKYIKFPDGSAKIIRPNGEELNLFSDGRIQYKDKSGKISNL